MSNKENNNRNSLSIDEYNELYGEADYWNECQPILTIDEQKEELKKVDDNANWILKNVL